MIEPTADDITNGWTAETLTEFIRAGEIAERDYAALNKGRVTRKVIGLARYNPKDW